MVFAVGTTDQILVYATDQIAPLVVVGNVHYAPINDISWHYSNEKLVACSSDGYCSIMTFASSPVEANLLGKRLDNEAVESEDLRKVFERADLNNFQLNEEKVKNEKQN